MKIKECLEIKEYDNERILKVPVFHVHRYKWYSDISSNWKDSAIIIYTDGESVKEIETSNIIYSDDLNSYAVIREYKSFIMKKPKREIIEIIYNPRSEW